MQKLNTHYQILCQPVSNKKISSLHMETGHKIDNYNLILNSGKRIDIRNLTNETFINSELQFISADMLVVGESPRYILLYKNIIELLTIPRIIHSGDRQLTWLEDTTVIFKDKSFTFITYET